MVGGLSGCLTIPLNSATAKLFLSCMVAVLVSQYAHTGNIAVSLPLNFLRNANYPLVNVSRDTIR